jgi:hypothetical protein
LNLLCCPAERAIERRIALAGARSIRSQFRALFARAEADTLLMKYSQLRRGLSPEDAAAYVGSKELLRQFERAKWLKPFVRGNRLTRFDIRDLDGCIDRLKAGEILSSGAPTP